tara:strand:+ start:4044 stop:4457 length:414 start_codon:yes stop_codon:yes gene_type:complete
MRVDGLIINFRAGALVAARRIVQHDGSAGAIQATGPTDPLLGVSDLGAASGAALDIRMGGIAPVDYGGAISAGDPITSDADGKAIAATAHTHTENTAGAYAQNATTGGASTVRIIGYAVVDGVDGDIGSVQIAPGQA